MPKSKKFIDRKNAVTFNVVHRSQHDPLIADENAPQHVLLPVMSKRDREKQIEEQQKFGVFFDDDYNYLQHLRDVNKTTVQWERNEPLQKEEKAKLNLPSSLFASKVEEKVGMLNKAAPHTGPRVDLDPDVVAAMDEDFDYEDPDNVLEDNFMELANASGDDADDESVSDVGSDDLYSEDDELGSLEGHELMFADEETKSRFTQYSMTSSVIRRNNQLTLLDSRFEKMFEGYDDTEIGALDCEEIEGYVEPNSNILLQCADEFERSRQLHQINKDETNAPVVLESDSSDDDDDYIQMEVKEEKEKWDCESILSTYSNIYNRPKLISEPRNNQKIKINMKTGLPVNILGQNKLTAKTLSQFDEQNNQALFGSDNPKSVCAKSIISTLSTLSIRPKDESPDERKERKRQLKEYRKARRLEKKINSEAFKEEAKRQVKIAINNKNNVQGNKIL